jgi:GNAT superfamily N-acetyltransferase
MKNIKMDEIKFYPLTDLNIKAVYRFLKSNEPFYSIPFEFFRRDTLDDESFDPNMSLVVYDPRDKNPIAFFYAVNTMGLIRKNCYLKICLVDKAYRRQGLGSKLLNEIITRAKSKVSFISSIYYGESRPKYWQPGVDLRHTSLYYFLKKNGFKKNHFRTNMTAVLKKIDVQPQPKKGNFTFDRILSDDFTNIVKFVKAQFPLGFWSQEIPLSFKNKPPTTFLAKDNQKNIVGWATHSTFFPGSFGPMGVKEELRGMGIGKELLKWCIWDMKENEIDICTIMWVEGDIREFYSKAIGAFIQPVFFSMSRFL